MARKELEDALNDPLSGTAHLRALLATELERSAAELERNRSGYEEPVTVAISPGLFAVMPTARGSRARMLAATLEAALAEAGDGQLQAGAHEGNRVLFLPDADAELAALAFDEAVAGIDRLRAAAVLVPADVIVAADLRPVLRGDNEDAVRPHADPDPARRVARRILQRLNGMGKWGGFHTEFTHLARGFHGNDQKLAHEVGEALVEAGLLTQKPSVGQRHVSLNSRRAGDIYRIIDTGDLPDDLRLPG